MEKFTGISSLNIWIFRITPILFVGIRCPSAQGYSQEHQAPVPLREDISSDACCRSLSRLVSTAHIDTCLCPALVLSRPVPSYPASRPVRCKRRETLKTTQPSERDMKASRNDRQKKPPKNQTTFQGESALPTLKSPPPDSAPVSLPFSLPPPATLTEPSRLPSSLLSLHPSSTAGTDPFRLSSAKKLYGRPLYPGGLGHCPLVATPSVSFDELARYFDSGRIPEL